MQIKTKSVSCHTANSKPVKQEVNSTVILPPLVFPGGSITHCTIDWFGISCMTTDNCCFYLQNRLIQTSQTGGQQDSDTSPFSIPWFLIHSLSQSFSMRDYYINLWIQCGFKRGIVAHASDFLSLKLPNCGLVLYALEGLECQG